mmetsp:Transcript_263/g.501  ORF Transcript_263/g.501 Transcript_263/m.501 type:complete len:150 (-) Transcript_263:890-1339(-)
MGNLRVVFVIIFLDLLCAGIFLPLLPYYAESAFGASPAMVGLLMGTYSACQLIASPFLGRLSDRMGRKPVMILCLSGMAIGYLLLAMSQSLWMLFLSRAISGFLGANNTVASAYIADMTSEQERTAGGWDSLALRSAWLSPLAQHLEVF